MLDHDVVIVGAGPVGLMLGCLLAQRGLDVAVCERRTGADERSRAIGIHPPGLDALEAAGIGGLVRAEALALEGGDVLSRGRTLASVDFTPERPVLVLPQYRTGALLRERLELVDPTALRSGCDALAVRDEGDFVRLTVDVGGVRRELTSSFLVAADGVRSGIREMLGVGWQPRRGVADYLMMDVADPSADSRARLHCEPGGLVESFPLPGGTRRWVVRDSSGGAATATRTRWTAADMRAAIEERTGIGLTVPDGARPTAFRAAQHLAARTVVGRVVLLGDAAHEISPIGGQGMNLGWLDAVRLTERIEQSLGRGTPDIRGFERRSRRTARRTQSRARFYMAMGAPAQPLGLHARELLIRALGSGARNGRMADMITMKGL
ncbi:MAG: NAD(P)/FAD-dependent oxidoreductase [Microbacterium sp.]|uniref:FAD-dependent oxidoreductase n=1 Tax=Microbacterium sp. TaxID=51671 RepID=UPI003BAEAE64